MKFQNPRLDLPKPGKPNFGLSIPKPSMEKFKKLPRKEKLHYIGYTVLLPATALMFIYGIFTNATTPDPVTQKKPAAAQEAQQTQQVEPPNQMVVKNEAAKGNILAQNPFIEASMLSMMDENDFSMQMPSSYSHMEDLPSIPSSPTYVPRPSLPSSLPTIPRVNPQVPSVPRPSTPEQDTSNQPTVDGVLTGEDGNNMAIMSDGRVVSAGDSYNGDRIAYIGGDGIKFDNGHSIGYK